MMRTLEKFCKQSLNTKVIRLKQQKQPKKGTEHSEKAFYNFALIDVRLPDMEGIEHSSTLCNTKPKMRRIIVTGYPTLQSAVSAVNKRADAYVMNPFEVEKILETIEEQLKKKEEEKIYSEDKVVEFI